MFASTHAEAKPRFPSFVRRPYGRAGSRHATEGFARTVVEAGCTVRCTPPSWHFLAASGMWTRWVAYQDMISDPSVHWPHTSPRQRQRMGNASTPRRVDISGCDFPHGVEPGGKVQSGQPAQPGHSAQDSDGNSLVCVKNTFIDLAPQTPKTRGQRRSMPTLPAGIGVYYS